MTGWLIFLGVVFLLAVLPLGVTVRYDARGFRLGLLAGPLRFWLDLRGLLEKKPEKPREKAEKKNAVQKQKKEKPQPEQKEPGDSWKDFLPLIRLALDFLGDFRRKLRINHLEMDLILAGDDPADLGILYGNAWAALGNLWPCLERSFVIKKRDVKVQCDFEAEETRFTMRADLTITLGRLLALAVRYGIRAIQEYLKIKNTKKAVLKHEQ